MSIEGKFSRRDFLKTLGATVATTGLGTTASVEKTEAAEKEEKKSTIKTQKLEPSLRGSAEAQMRQNQKAKEADLSRIKDEKELEKFVKNGLLVPLPEDDTLRIDRNLQDEFRYVRPWTKRFLQDVGKEFHAKFKKQIQVNSAVRTLTYQEELRGHNRNAATPDGPKASSHPTGATIDIAILPMTREELQWARAKFLALEKRGVIEVTEEYGQRVFHIMVFKNYTDKTNGRIGK